MKKLKKLLYGIIALCCSASFSACDLGDVMGDLGLPSNGIFGENTDKDDSIDISKDSTSDKSEISDDSDTSSDSSDTSSDSSDTSSDSSGENPDMPDIVTDELSIHFLFLGNKTSGDCALIKVGDTEVLIDAGSKKGSAATIVEYVDEYCEDGILEYVIATHAHEDHIAGFVGTSTAEGVFESYECETIIDYPLSNVTTAIRADYEELRDAEVEAGAKHYTALECWNETNGAKRSYELGQDVTLNILYQKYYEQSTSTENNYSVCVMITQDENNYLFTGDLEESGEKSLVESNDLPKCTLYKAGHHGSNTASSKALIDVIQPELVVACCCCGDKHNFPHQEFIENIAPYTDKLYIPVMVDDSVLAGYTLLNGNIVVWSDGKEVDVACSNNDVLFKDTEWFKANRETPTSWQ